MSQRITRPREARLVLERGILDRDDPAGAEARRLIVGETTPISVVDAAHEPFVGVSADGHPRPRDPGADTGFDPAAPVAAADAYLRLLGADRRRVAVLPLEAPEWRMWTNAFVTFPEHGLQLQDLAPDQRDAALAVVEACLGPRGFARIRQAMRLNGTLGELVGYAPDTLNEFCYWFTLFGDPSAAQPWGWQLFGHHVDVHCLMYDGRVVLTPTFIGCELGGEGLFAPHQASAQRFMADLRPRQRDEAVRFSSILAQDLPDELTGRIDGRMVTGAGRDNAVLAPTGLRGDSLSAGQQELLLEMLAPYSDTIPDGAQASHRERVVRHLDETHVSWIGSWGPDDAFYYRIHSPILLVEYDNHAGIFLDNEEPERFHVHTIVRTPEGGDYGRGLLREHYERHHTERSIS